MIEFILIILAIFLLVAGVVCWYMALKEGMTELETEVENLEAKVHILESSR